MRNRIVIFAVIGLAVLAGCTCDPAAIGSQPVTLRSQQTSMWCWAASGQMIMEFLGHGVNQCDQANNRFARTDCCNNPTPGGCVQGGWPEFDKYNFTFKTTSDTALSWDEVRRQIFCRRTPFAFSWHWTGGGGHMMDVIGYVTIDGVNYVTINDPWPPNVGDQRTITYNAYISGSGYTHWNDYYDIAYTGT